MRRSIAFILILSCLFWRAPLFAGDVVLTSAPENGGHLLLHWQDEHHHHHHDGSFHEGDSQESIEHLALDSALSVTAALAHPMFTPSLSLSHTLSAATDVAVCSVCRDRLRRPPRDLS